MAVPASVSPHDQLTSRRRGRRSDHSSRDRNPRGAAGAVSAAFWMTRLLSGLTLIVLAVGLLPPTNAFGQAAPTPAPAEATQLSVAGRSPIGTVTPIQTPNPNTRGGNALNGTIQVEGAFQGSTPTGVATAEPLPLNLSEAFRRALPY